MATEHDQWSRWVLERRDGGSRRQRAIALEFLAPIRDRVLDAAEPLDGATLLDVGSGDGLIGLAGLERVGAHGVVIFSDVSEVLLEQCRLLVADRSATTQARFVQDRRTASTDSGFRPSATLRRR